METESEKDRVLRKNIVKETAAIYLGRREVMAAKKDSTRLLSILRGLGKSFSFMFFLVLQSRLIRFFLANSFLRERLVKALSPMIVAPFVSFVSW